MRASTVFVTLFATLAVAIPAPGPKNELSAVDEASLLVARQGAPAGTCNKPDKDGSACAALKCQSNSKSGRGNKVRSRSACSATWDMGWFPVYGGLSQLGERTMTPLYGWNSQGLADESQQHFFSFLEAIERVL